MSLYGYCPQCGERGVRRERRLGGNDTCEAGHTYPTAQSHSQPDVLIARLTRERSDHAAVVGKITEELDSLRAALRDALAAHSDHAAELARVEGERDANRRLLNKALKENTLLRAECEAWRAWFAWKFGDGNEKCSDTVSELQTARAATDAANILKGAE